MVMTPMDDKEKAENEAACRRLKMNEAVKKLKSGILALAKECKQYPLRTDMLYVERRLNELLEPLDQIYQLFPKSPDNPDGYELQPELKHCLLGFSFQKGKWLAPPVLTDEDIMGATGAGIVLSGHRRLVAKTASIKDKKIEYWREKCWNDTMSAKKSGWDDAEKWFKSKCQDRVDKLLKEIERKFIYYLPPKIGHNSLDFHPKENCFKCMWQSLLEREGRKQ